MKKGYKNICVDLPVDVKQDFKMACLRNRETQHEVIVNFVNKYIKNTNNEQNEKINKVNKDR